MTPEDEPTSTDETPEDQRQTPADDTERADPDTVAVDTSHLDRARAAIDDAREAVKKVAATDSIEDEATGAGELPAFADATDDAEQPKPPQDDVAPAADRASSDDSAGDDRTS